MNHSTIKSPKYSDELKKVPNSHDDFKEETNALFELDIKTVTINTELIETSPLTHAVCTVQSRACTTMVC